MEYRLLSDEVLLKLLKASDEAAFKELYHRYWIKIYTNALSKIHIKEVAEELVQNIFITLWEKRFATSILHPENYFYTAIKYQIINYLKSNIIKEKYLQGLKLQLSEDEDNCDTKVLLKELTHKINDAILRLPEKTQVIFNLSRSENRTIKEISQSMNLSEKAVEYHITKSLKILRLYLKEFVFLILFLLNIYLSS
ncbi:MAG: sigma-70 family RNA polymerase sigma factor [Chitinophagaceae bacterium]